MDSMIFTYKYKLCHRNRYRLYTDIDIYYNIDVDMDNNTNNDHPCCWRVPGVCLACA